MELHKSQKNLPNTPDTAFWLALNEFPKFGPRAMTRLALAFENMEQAFYANEEELINAGIPRKHAEGFIHSREEIHPERLIPEILREGFQVKTLIDEDYPSLLKEIYDPPAVLYVWGQLPPDDVTHLAVVGSRFASPYGLRVAQELTTIISKSGVAIVSGLAFGIDEAVHRATIASEGVTIAVLACGLKKMDSRQHYIAEHIVKSGGAVISEFPLHTRALTHHFPYRNRVISGLSHGTLVIEAAEKSGSLITARAAIEQNRDVFAVPGPIHAITSKGTNQLIKNGAHVVTEANDVLQLLHLDTRAPNIAPTYTPETPEEEAILPLLSKTPVHINEIIRVTGLEGAQVASTLSLLEIQGRTQQIGGMYYILV